MSLYHCKREKETRKKGTTREREHSFSEAISVDALNGMDEIFVISQKKTRANYVQQINSPKL